jgi:hypothetical protein
MGGSAAPFCSNSIHALVLSTHNCGHDRAVRVTGREIPMAIHLNPFGPLLDHFTYATTNSWSAR